MTRKGKIIGFINIVISIVLLLLSISTAIYPLFPDVKNIMRYVNMVSVIIMALQVVVICLSHTYEKIVENEIFHMSKRQVYEKIKPYSQGSALQDAREELRFGLHILLFVAILAYAYLCIRFQNILLFCAGTGFILLAYIYADYIPNAMRYAKSYDKYIGKKEKGNSTRGLATIYLEEYRKTQFDRNHEFYKEVSDYDFDDNDRIQDNCVKCILFMKADSIRHPETVHAILLMAANWILVIPNLSFYIIKEFMGEVKTDAFFIRTMISVIVNVIIAIINIIICVAYKGKCEDIKTISDVINDTKKSGRKKRFDEYENWRKNESRSKFEAIRSRGVFVYCSTFISNKKSLDNIPLKYRMLYIHKYYTNVPRFRITAGLLIFCMVALLMEYGVSTQIIFFLSLIYLLIVFLFGKLVLPNLGKRRIAKKCRELIECSMNAD